MAETDGYWGEGFYGEGFWGEGYWGEYTTSPITTPDAGTGGLATLRRNRWVLLLKVKKFLEAELE